MHQFYSLILFIHLFLPSFWEDQHFLLLSSSCGWEKMIALTSWVHKLLSQKTKTDSFLSSFKFPGQWFWVVQLGLNGYCWSSSLFSSRCCCHARLFCNPRDCNLPGSSVHGILQARIVEWVTMLSSRGSSQPRDWNCISYISCIGRWVLYH